MAGWHRPRRPAAAFASTMRRSPNGLAGMESCAMAEKMPVAQGWPVEEALRFVHLADASEIYWFEEPCRWDNDRLAMRNVRLKGNIRVCAGQTEFSAGDCRDLMTAEAIDVCNFDASWSGGPTEWRRVAATAALFG